MRPIAVDWTRSFRVREEPPILRICPRRDSNFIRTWPIARARSMRRMGLSCISQCCETDSLDHDRESETRRFTQFD